MTYLEAKELINKYLIVHSNILVSKTEPNIKHRINYVFIAPISLDLFNQHITNIRNNRDNLFTDSAEIEFDIYFSTSSVTSGAKYISLTEFLSDYDLFITLKQKINILRSIWLIHQDAFFAYDTKLNQNIRREVMPNILELQEKEQLKNSLIIAQNAYLTFLNKALKSFEFEYEITQHIIE